MTTKKKALRPSRAKSTRRRPAAKGRTPRRTATKAPAKRETQGDRLINLLRRKGGITMADAAKALGIQEHSARSLLSTEVRRRGVKVERLEGRRYHIAG